MSYKEGTLPGIVGGIVTVIGGGSDFWSHHRVAGHVAD